MYIVRENNSLKKYNVSINLKKIKKIRDKLFNECKIIYHVNDVCLCHGYGSATKMINNGKEHLFWSRVKNYIPKRCIYSGRYEFDSAKYYLEYDFYEVPKVIELLDEAIGYIEYDEVGYEYYTKNLDMVSKLESKNRTYMYNVNLDEVIFKLLNFHDLGYSNNLGKFTDSQNIIKVFETDKKKEKLISDSIRKIKECITITLVDELDYDTYNKTIKFLDEDAKALEDNEVLKYIKEKKNKNDINKRK